MTALAITEAEWQEQIIHLAHILGWHHNHTRRSIGKGTRWTTATSTKGWPDLTLWHPTRGGVIFAELKTDTGIVTAEQQHVLDELTAAGAEAYVWRPSMLDTIHARLAA